MGTGRLLGVGLGCQNNSHGASPHGNYYCVYYIAGMTTPRPARYVPLWASALLGVLAVLFLIGAIIYFTKTAGQLPSFFPGHQAGSRHHHSKHGIALLVLAVVCLAGIWFGSGDARLSPPGSKDERQALPSDRITQRRLCSWVGALGDLCSASPGTLTSELATFACFVAVPSTAAPAACRECPRSISADRQIVRPAVPRHLRATPPIDNRTRDQGSNTTFGYVSFGVTKADVVVAVRRSVHAVAGTQLVDSVEAGSVPVGVPWDASVAWRLFAGDGLAFGRLVNRSIVDAAS